ncbi:MAG: hypothetical protein WDN46_06685 [Methylocella sp.]
MKLASIIALPLALSTVAAHAHETGKIIIANWKPCDTGIQTDEISWAEIPVWARAKSLRPYYYGEPRLLANHGLCNEKFHRIVLCLPGWEESDDKTAGWFKVCQGYQNNRQQK